ncbi:RagB/SusD family nutrient uptake outer membrane protein [Arachidicoccus terrestris]|uniref:RagB/SusD family nutrient uptake outer membrane protein n=1 Tax=Arachidicoccus terrestris TaxID=2875539 RepID=UPI001CC4ABB8|nr:RagB/SusD family nutrient uptake outer membrane protein [Arachidicoccus terrestris]UAY53782.1 RagB/SusD family nutrient uptake outer membrane protein [Arachidicoccus terrestris]
MKYINKCFGKVLLLALTVLVLATGCTKLTENTYTDIQYNQFYKNRRDVMEAALRPFTHMQAWLAPTGQNGYYYHSELSADQLAWPQKGRHGYDGGDHIRMHYHTWTADENRMQNCWSLIWTGIGFCNSAITDIAKLDTAQVGMSEVELTAVLSELKVLRAFSYMKAMDLWGNIPISTDVPVGSQIVLTATKPRDSVFDFVRKELEENVPKLLPNSNELIGRVSQTAGYAMLAELYLNAQTWRGVPMWDECIKACDKILSGQAGGINGGPALAPDINEVFSNTNWRSKEPLFEIAYSKKGGFTFDWTGFFSSYDYMEAALGVDYSGWNAFVTTPSGFNQFDDADLRKKDWFLFGPQYELGTKTPILGSEEYKGKPIVFVNSIRRESEGDHTSAGGMTKGEENSGARFNKYKSGRLGDPNYRENHYIIYRLTEIYFDKAEALMRKNGGKATAEAVQLINDSRKRAFSAKDWPSKQYTTSNFTLDSLLAERGREFFFEGKRREDLIRFGKFTTTSWWDHKADNDPNKALFPIPNTQLGANPELKQNPGYE